MDHVRQAATAALLAVALAGCEGEAPAQDPLIDTRAADPVVATRGGLALSGSSGLIRFGQLFRASNPDVTNVGAAVIAGIQFNVVLAVLERYYEQSLGCAPQGRLSAGELTLTATFGDDGCTGPLGAEGSFVATAAVQTAACEDDDGVCPSAIVWTVEADGLRFINPLRPFSPTYDGTMTFRSPFVESEPMQWRTGPDFTMGFDLGTLGLESEVSWTYDRQSECLDADLSGRVRLLEVDASLDDLDRRIGETVYEVDGYRRCGDSCPERGDVNLIYGYGEVLRWTYDGGDDAEVIGPRGRALEVGLPCGM